MTITKKISTSRASIALTKETNTKLKDFSKKYNLRMYEALDSMVDVAASNIDFALAVIKLTEERAKEKQEEKSAFSRNLKKLPIELSDKLKSMSAEELEALLSKIDQ